MSNNSNDPNIKVKLFSNSLSGNTYNTYDGGLESKSGIGLNLELV